MGANQGYATVGEILITEDATLFKSINASGNIVDPVNAVDGNNLTSWSNNNNPGDKIFDLTLTKPIKAAAVTIIALDVFRIDTYLGTTCTKTGAATTLGGTENIKIVDPGTFDKLRFYSTNAGNIITEIGLAEIDVNALSLSYNYDETGNMYYRTIVYSGTKSAKITMRDTIIYMEKESKGVEDKFMHATINVYPNPTSGIIKIEYSKNSSQSILRLQLFSNNGVLLMNKAITDENTLDISNKPSGVYIMNITIDGETHKWTIIKE
jgi:hypothetical protein